MKYVLLALPLNRKILQWELRELQFHWITRRSTMFFFLPGWKSGPLSYRTEVNIISEPIGDDSQLEFQYSCGSKLHSYLRISFFSFQGLGAHSTVYTPIGKQLETSSPVANWNCATETFERLSGRLTAQESEPIQKNSTVSACRFGLDLFFSLRLRTTINAQFLDGKYTQWVEIIVFLRQVLGLNSEH